MNKLTQSFTALQKIVNSEALEVANTAVGITYLKGTGVEEGDIRLRKETRDTVIEQLDNEGVWRPSSMRLGSTTLWLGYTVGVSGIGHHLATEAEDGHLHFHAHGEFDGEISTADAKMLHATAYAPRVIYQPDFSGEFIGKQIGWTMVSPLHIIAKALYLKTGSVAATVPVRVRTWTGTDDTGSLMIDLTIGASRFPANSDINLNTDGFIEYDEGANYYIQYDSDEDFSFKTNIAGTEPYLEADTIFVTEDNLLQTARYEDGGTYALDQWMIDDRKIYVCNTAGVQTGTFASNSTLWDLLSSPDVVNSKWTRSGGELSPTGGENIKLALGGYLDANGSLLKNLLAPSTDQDASTKKYVNDEDAALNTALRQYVDDATKYELPDGTITGSPLAWNGSSWVEETGIVITGRVLSNLLDPVLAQEAATKQYVDDHSSDTTMWNRTGTTISPLNIGDRVGLGTTDLSTSIGGVEARLKVKSVAPSSNPLAVESTLGTDLFLVRQSTDGDGQILILDKTEALTVQITSDEEDSYILNGNIGIGTDTPSNKLTIKTGVDNDGIYLLNGLGVERARLATNGIDHSYLKLTDGTNTVAIELATEPNTDSFINTTGGNLGIGIILPTEKLHVENGNILVSNGNINSYGAGGYNSNQVAGLDAGAAMVNGEYNAFYGTRVGNISTDISQCTLMGYEAGMNASLADCVGIGYFSLKGATCTNTMAFGSYAGRDSTGAGCLYLGYDQGLNNTTDKKLFIGNTNHSLLEGYFHSTAGWLKVHGDLEVTGDAVIGGNPVPLGNPLHVYQNNTNTNASAGIVIEQAGTGDALLHFLMTGSRFWTMGLDNSDGDKFKISIDAELGLGKDYFVIDDDNGNVGIGITDPLQTLDVRYGTKTVGNAVIASFGTTEVQPIALNFGKIGSVTAVNRGMSIDVSEVGVSDDRPLVLQIYGGGVGIGVIVPNAKLDVNGDAIIATDLTLTGGDLLSDSDSFGIYNKAYDVDDPLLELDFLNDRGQFHGRLGVGTPANQAILQVHSASCTTDNILQVSCSTLTTGDIASLHGGSDDLGSRAIMHLHNSSVLATGVTVLDLDNDSTGLTLNCGGDAIFSGDVGIGGVVNPDAWLDVMGSSASGHSLQLRAGGGAGSDTAQIIFSYDGRSFDDIGYAHSIRTRHSVVSDVLNAIDFWMWDTGDSPSTLGDNLVMSVLGSGDVAVLNALRSSANYITSDGLSQALVSDSGATIDIANEFYANSLTTGNLAIFHSNSASTGTRSLVKMHNKHALATNVTVLDLQNDGGGVALNTEGSIEINSGFLRILNGGDMFLVGGGDIVLDTGKIELVSGGIELNTGSILLGTGDVTIADGSLYVVNGNTHITNSSVMLYGSALSFVAFGGVTPTFIVPKMTDAARNAKGGTIGEIIYNTSGEIHQCYSNAGWRNLY